MIIEAPIKLLEAVARFAYTDDSRPHLRGIHVAAPEIAATDGTRLVRIDMRACEPFRGSTFEKGAEPFTIDLPTIGALARAMQSRGRVRIRREGKELHFDMLGASERVDRTLIDRAILLPFPPVDQVMVTRRVGEAPPELTFNPSFFSDVSGVVDEIASYGRRGVRITGWGADTISPIQLETDGARFVLMPIRTGAE